MMEPNEARWPGEGQASTMHSTRTLGNTDLTDPDL